MRVVINWRNTGLTFPTNPVNVLHVSAGAGDETDVAGRIQDYFFANQGDLFPLTSDDYVVESYACTELDGSSAAVVTESTGVAGQSGGDWIPQGAMVVGWQTGVRGPTGRGRIYLGPVAESANINGALQFGSSDPGGAWSGFIDDLNTGGFPLVVASYTHLVKRTVTGRTIHPFLRTMRSRAPKNG